MDPTPLGNDTAAGVLVILAVYGVFVAVVLLISYLLTAATLMLLFRKVGIAPGLAWIPVYNHWKWLELGGQPGALALLRLTPAAVVAWVFQVLGMHRTGIAFGKESGWLVLGIFLPWLWCILLSSRDETYDPSLIVAAGYPPPRAGIGAVKPG
jgi:hypothetical protein